MVTPTGLIEFKTMAQAQNDAPYIDELYTGSYRPIDTAGLIASMPNWKGTPTVYTDDKGTVKGVYTSAGVVPVESLNPLIRPGERITADTPVQEVGEDGAKLYLRDPLDPESKTYENTGIPSIAGTVAQQGFVPQRNSNPFSTFGSDIAGMLRDPAFHKFLAGAAAITGGGLALNSMYGVGGLGSGAVASPVSLGGAIPATELGAGAAGTGGVGSVVGPTGAGEFLAADAAATAAGQGAVNAAASLGMPLEQAVSQGLITGSGTLTNAGAAALMGGEVAAGISPLKALQIASLARSGLGALGGLAGPGAAVAAALAAARANQNAQSGVKEPIPELTLDWGYQYTPNERPGVAMSQQYLNPRFFQEGGLSSLEDARSQQEGQPVNFVNVIDEIRDIVNEEEKPFLNVPENRTGYQVTNPDVLDAYRSLLQDMDSRQAAIIPRLNYQQSTPENPNIGAGNLGVTIPVGQGAINADIYGTRMNMPDYKRSGINALGLGYEAPLGDGRISASVNKPLNAPGIGGMLNYERRFAMGGDIGARYTSPDDTGNGDKVGAHQTVNMAPHYPMQGIGQGYAQGGLSDLGGYSDGGRMLKGPGDGMSDSIPASIENKRPARLATDEFVVPADVVSHLGNGSSDAGAKVLYSMMDRVRQARTGQKKQGKQINPNKFMPA